MQQALRLLAPHMPHTRLAPCVQLLMDVPFFQSLRAHAVKGAIWLVFQGVIIANVVLRVRFTV